MSEKNQNQLTENTLVHLGTVAVVVCCLVTITWKISAWGTEMTNRLLQIDESVKKLTVNTRTMGDALDRKRDRGPQDFTRAQADLFLRDVSDLNSLELPDIWGDRYDPKDY